MHDPLRAEKNTAHGAQLDNFVAHLLKKYHSNKGLILVTNSCKGSWVAQYLFIVKLVFQDEETGAGETQKDLTLTESNQELS